MFTQVSLSLSPTRYALVGNTDIEFSYELTGLGIDPRSFKASAPNGRCMNICTTPWLLLQDHSRNRVGCDMLSSSSLWRVLLCYMCPVTSTLIPNLHSLSDRGIRGWAGPELGLSMVVAPCPERALTRPGRRLPFQWMTGASPLTLLPSIVRNDTKLSPQALQAMEEI